jgi:chromatin modification-related protein VID21
MMLNAQNSLRPAMRMGPNGQPIPNMAVSQQQILSAVAAAASAAGRPGGMQGLVQAGLPGLQGLQGQHGRPAPGQPGSGPGQGQGLGGQGQGQMGQNPAGNQQQQHHIQMLQAQQMAAAQAQARAQQVQAQNQLGQVGQGGGGQPTQGQAVRNASTPQMPPNALSGSPYIQSTGELPGNSPAMASQSLGHAGSPQLSQGQMQAGTSQQNGQSGPAGRVPSVPQHMRVTSNGSSNGSPRMQSSVPPGSGAGPGPGSIQAGQGQVPMQLAQLAQGNQAALMNGGALQQVIAQLTANGQPPTAEQIRGIQATLVRNVSGFVGCGMLGWYVGAWGTETLGSQLMY